MTKTKPNQPPLTPKLKKKSLFLTDAVVIHYIKFLFKIIVQKVLSVLTSSYILFVNEITVRFF